MSRARQMVAIFLVSLAGLLLEVGYTRVVSYKLWYYYTYLVIGLALLGIGSGGILVVLWKRLRVAATDRIIAVCSVLGGLSILVGYLIISRVPVNTLVIWDYGRAGSFKNLAVLGLISFSLFASFIALGVIIAVILGRAPEGGIGRLYFADLVGAALGCLAAIPLITRMGPPDVILFAALIFIAVGLFALPYNVGAFTKVVAGAGAAVGLALVLILSGIVSLPDVRVEDTKTGSQDTAYGDWGPVFRVDVLFVSDDAALLLHDGTFGSRMNRFDGNAKALTQYDTDPRAIPFRTMGRPPDRELIIGSAAGNEILASRHFNAKRIEAVELNPVTLSLLRDKDKYKDLTGDLESQPGVSMHQGDGRTYLARGGKDYDLIWYVAPDSYAANNAASSGAFVLSESYLYTKEMIEDSLKHLTDDGMMVVQFGELYFGGAPNRTARYVNTARAALEASGVENPGDHILVSAFITEQSGDLSTIMVKRTPFTKAEIERYNAAVPDLPMVSTAWAPGQTEKDNVVAQLAGGTDAEIAAVMAKYPREIDAITDDSPFFWHFADFDDVIGNIFEPFSDRDPEDTIGERVLLLLLSLAIVYAAVFLLAPFFFVRKEWRALPAKGISALFFACLGLGFMFFEITMIQRLVLFLGYPTYSLTVTLASILVFTGLGALASRRFAANARLMPILIVALAALTVLYQFGLEDITDSLLSEGLAVRVVVSILLLAPLGFILGMFMPLGLGVVAGLSAHGDEYVAWGWAVNGFFSVIGSVLTTILAMSYGFRLVQYVALAIYVIAALAFTRLRSIAKRTVDVTAEPPPEPRPEPAISTT